MKTLCLLVGLFLGSILVHGFASPVDAKVGSGEEEVAPPLAQSPFTETDLGTGILVEELPRTGHGPSRYACRREGKRPNQRGTAAVFGAAKLAVGQKVQIYRLWYANPQPDGTVLIWVEPVVEKQAPK